MSHINSRILDAAEERLNTLTPLRGYAHERLVSLQDAVVPLRKLVDDIDSRVWTAINRAENPADKLTPNESAAIILYTIEWDPSHPSLYLVLNRTLRLEDRRKLVPWFPYIKLLLTGLFKLPSVRCTIWRGVRGDLRSQYRLGSKMTWWAFSSCTTSIGVLENEQYLGVSGVRTLFAIECLNGKDIKRHSYFSQEEEILLLPCTYFQVVSHLSSGNNLYIIHLRELQPPFMLLEPPDPSLASSNNETAGNEQLKFKLEQLKDENKRLTTQCKQQQAQVSQQQAMIGKLEDEIQVLNKNYGDQEKEIQSLNKKVQQADKIAGHLEGENQNLRRENEHVNRETERLQRENDQLKRNVDTSAGPPKISLTPLKEPAKRDSPVALSKMTGSDEFDLSALKLNTNYISI